MVTPSRFFAPTKSPQTEQHDNAAERESLHRPFEQDGAEISILSDDTRLETGKPVLTQEGLYSISLAMIVGTDQHRRTMVVKAREGETERAVKQRVHAVFVKSVCEAKSVVPMTPMPDEKSSYRSRRVHIR